MVILMPGGMNISSPTRKSFGLSGNKSLVELVSKVMLFLSLSLLPLCLLSGHMTYM